MKHLNPFHKKVIISTVLMLGTANLANAQSSLPTKDEFVLYVILGLVCTIALLVLLVAVYVLRILQVIVEDTARKKARNEGVEFIAQPSLWNKLMLRLTNATPIENEAAIELDHDYDGIKELDNHLPPWWTYLFYLTVVFSVVYIFIYHISGSLPLQDEEYAQELALAEKNKAESQTASVNNIDETNIQFTSDPQNLSNGQKIFEMQCAACHKATGAGGIGPNLTDEYWLHGGSIKDIFTAIKYGIPDKGMIAWEPLLSPTQMQDVSSYIRTLKGTNPQNPKAPQGELFKEVETTTDSIQAI